MALGGSAEMANDGMEKNQRSRGEGEKRRGICLYVHDVRMYARTRECDERSNLFFLS